MIPETPPSSSPNTSGATRSKTTPRYEGIAIHREHVAALMQALSGPRTAPPPVYATGQTDLTGRVNRTLKMIHEYGDTDGAHHKQWLLNQIALTLTDGTYSLEDPGTAP